VTLALAQSLANALLSFLFVRVGLDLFMQRRMTYDLATSRPEGVEVRGNPEGLARLRASAPEGTEVPELPPFPLEPHLFQLRLFRRVRTWEVFIPDFIVEGIKAGLFVLHVEVLPPRTRVKMVPISPPPPPRPPRPPRGGKKMRSPRWRPVQAGGLGWAGA